MDWSFYDPFKGKEPHRPFSDKCYRIFEVLDSGTWYKIDTTCFRPEFYPGIPEEIIVRAREAVHRAPACGHLTDPAPHHEAVLRKEFDDVRFLGTDFVPGVVC